MVDVRRLFGNSAEDLASRFLKKKGYKILTKQYKTKFGEIDLIAKDGNEIVFVEVKARKSNAFGFPEEAVTKSKINKIQAVAYEFLQVKALLRNSYRIDVVAIEYKFNPPRITHIISV